MSLRALYTALTVSLLFAGCTQQAEVDEAQVVEAICCGANCCLIEGTCRTRGTRNPANMCEQCDPSTDQTSWSPVAGCGAVDAGFPDTGVVQPDATAPEDASLPPADAGNNPPADSGVVTPRDASSGNDPMPNRDDGGCACVSAKQISGGSFALLLLGALVILRRRSR